MIRFNAWAEIRKLGMSNEDGMPVVTYNKIGTERVRLDFTSDRSRKDLQLLASTTAPGTIPDRTVLVFASHRTALKTGYELWISQGVYAGHWKIEDPPVPVGVGLTGRPDHFEAIAKETEASAARSL